jgi:predicted transport protein
LRNRPPEIVSLYEQLEAFVKKLGPVEFVTRDRYVLLRSKRIFADLVITPMALRLAVHLPRQIEHALIIKVVSDGRRVTHVAKLHNEQQLAAFKPHLREAYKFSLL